jgi:hypothetical protein
MLFAVSYGNPFMRLLAAFGNPFMTAQAGFQNAFQSLGFELEITNIYL